MSKKVWIIGAVITAVILALPMVGNMSVAKMTNERIAMLENNGIAVTSSDNGSSYMSTKSHYEFKLKDAVAFKAYLDSLSKAQVPAYMSTMLDDVVMAADVEYSNVLFNSDISLDLYPVAFTDEASKRMQSEDALLYDQMMQMLKERAFLYHMDYDVAGSAFKGYIKDIDKEIAFQDGKKAKIVFDSATFDGKGTLVEPTSVDLHVKQAAVDFRLPEDASMVLNLSDLESKSHFSAKNSFDLEYKAKHLYFKFKDILSTMEIKAENMTSTSSSITTDGKLNTKVTAEVEDFEMKETNSSLKFKQLVLDVDANGIDAAAYEAFQKASEQAGSNSQYTMLAVVGVLAKGFTLNVDTLSVKQLSIRDSAMMDGFNHKIKIEVKKDDKLVQKIQVSPLALMQNINIDADLRFKEKFYEYLKAQGGNLAMADSYAKKDQGDVRFEILVKDGKITVNGMAL